MTSRNALRWAGGLFLAVMVLLVLCVLLFDWNWLRATIERKTMEKTGRELVITGNLSARFGWPYPRMRAEGVTFANPAWASDKQMISAGAVEVTVDLPALLARKIILPEVRLEHPVVALEISVDGRKNWLLDRDQQDEDARVQIDLLTLDQGRISYKDPRQKTRVDAEISTLSALQAGTPHPGLEFSARGTYNGLSLAARGRGGPVLALRDEDTPYRLNVDAGIGHTEVKADGTITGLLKFSAVDLRLDLRGDSLAQLFPLLNIALPETHPYSTKGHLLHSARMWRYESFTGRIGKSDVAGTLQIDAGATRPFLHGDVLFAKLDIDDLGPVVGVKETVPARVPARAVSAVPLATAPPSGKRGGPDAAQSPTTPVAVASARMLPDIPFRTERWDSVDTEVNLRARTILREKNLPLENFSTTLKLRDAVLTLDPLNFGMAGGDLVGSIALDGRQEPIRAKVKVRVRKVLIAKLFPAVDLTKTSAGQINGAFDLAGSGNSVGRMLASSNGKIGLVIADGEISKMMMETVGLHLWEMLQLKIAGDKTIVIRCGVGNFSVKSGVMKADAFFLDTSVTTINGTGSIDLGQERLDITIRQKTKNTSVVALRGPIYVRGSFAKPDVRLDTARVAMRGGGAIALGLINPLLVLLPLVETGPGTDSDCGRLIGEAQAMPGKSVPVPSGTPAR